MRTLSRRFPLNALHRRWLPALACLLAPALALMSPLALAERVVYRASGTFEEIIGIESFDIVRDTIDLVSTAPGYQGDSVGTALIGREFELEFGFDTAVASRVGSGRHVSFETGLPFAVRVGGEVILRSETAFGGHRVDGSGGDLWQVGSGDPVVAPVLGPALDVFYDGERRGPAEIFGATLFGVDREGTIFADNPPSVTAADPGAFSGPDDIVSLNVSFSDLTQTDEVFTIFLSGPVDKFDAVSSVPLPGALVLMLSGLGLFASMRRRRY